MTSPLGFAVGLWFLSGALFTNFYMCDLLITQLLWLVGGLNSINRFYYTSWMTLGTPTDRPEVGPQSLCIEGFGGVFIMTIDFHFLMV